MATSTTEAEYVAAANCCEQVLWVQNQLLDYGFNFMNIKIYIDNESTICIVKNPVFHTRPKLSTTRPKLSTDSTKIESMKLEAMMEERRIFKCWFHYHTTNGHQFTMSNRHQELASPEQTASELASPKQTALGKDISNPLIVDSLLKTIWLSMHHVIAMKHWLFQSKRLLIYSMAGEDEFHDDNTPPPPPPVTPTQQALTLCQLLNSLFRRMGNGPVQVLTDTNGQIKVLPPKTAKEILARERERKARTTLLMAIPEDHLAKFHKMTDAKEMREAIKSIFGGNDESKKMQKYIFKQQFESFSVSNSEGLHKGYNRFQSLLSQLEIHGASVSNEDANQKFLKSLPTSWSQVSLIMRTKPGVDTLSFDDLYNNLRVFEFDIKGSTASSSSTQNVAFVSSESTNNTNDYSFFANQSSGPQLYHEDLEQVDEFDLEEMDLKWQVAMISMRLKKFYKKTGRRLQFDAKEPVGFDKTKVECFNCHNTWHFARECRSKGNQESRRRDAGNTRYKAKDNGRRPGKQEEPKSLVTLDGEGIDWTGHAEDEQENFALMAYSNSGSDTEVTSCSKECVESYAKLKKLYDTQREQLGDASIEIQAYTQALKKVEAQLVAHQKNQLWYEEKIRFMKIDLDDKTDVLTYHKKLLAEAVKEKEELKTKLENFQSSSKGLSKLLNSQMSTRDKSGLGYGNQIHEGVLSYEKEVLESVFDSRSSDVEDSPVNDRFAKVEGMHAVPPPMTGNYMPPKSDFGIDESNFTYGPKQSKTSESDAKTSDFDSCETNSSVETLESVPEPVVVEPKVVSQPKVWSDAPIIEEYESDSDDEYVIEPSKEQEKPSFAFVNTVKHVKTPRETVKEQNTCSPSPKVNKRDWNGLMSKKLGLGYGFTKKACFVCGSFSHLIRDCDFHEKRMAKQVELNKKKGKGTGQGENRPVWNNVQRLNHQNKFVPKAVLTKTGIFPVNTARQNPSSQAAETSTARKVNTARPIVNEIRPRNTFYKSHSPIRRPFNKSTAPKANFTNHKVNTAGDKTVSAVRGYRETAVKASAGCNWRPKRHYWNKVSKYNSGSNSSKNVNFKDPQGRPKSAMAWVGDEAVHKELGDRMERATTTTSSLKVEQDSDAQTRFEAASKSLMIHLSQELTHLDVGEDNMKLMEFMAHKTIPEASLRRHLKLEDNGGVTTLPNSEIFEQLALMGYATDYDKLTFQKGNFSPQWRFFIHTILHCLSPKKTAWEQFSSNIATAIICLATTRTFNFSKFIFDAMVKNLDNPHKFLMYPRFIQISLNKQRRLLQPHTRTYSTHVLTQKVFSNMKRVTKDYSGEDIPLFASMITSSETSPSRITSSPSLLPQHTPFTASSTSQPSNIHTTPVTEEAASMPHESPLQSVHLLGRDEGSLSLHELMVLCTNLSNKVTSLEAELAQTKQTYGTALTKLIKKRFRRRLVVILSGEKGEQEVTTADTTLNTASVLISTSSATPEVSTTAANLVYIRRSAEKRKDKGKAIMIEDESVQKKSKKQLEQERLSHEEAIRLQEQINEEERKRIARDAKIAKQLQEEYDKARKKEVVAEVDTTHVIDWNDPSGGYKMKDFKGMSYDDIRLIFEKVWDQVHSFVPMDSEEEVQRLKRAGQDVEAKPAKRQRTKEVSESVQEQTDEEPKTDELPQEQLNQMVIIVPNKGINIEALQIKYPIIGWEVYSEDTMQFWKIIRVGNHTEVYQVFEYMLKNFDRDDLIKLWSLVQERYNSSGLTEDKEIEL
ncbi:ribonuclease H-like domain-containing protein [Tanacetum coccineum]